MASAAWIAAAATLGFGVSALFSGVLELSRNWYLVPYFVVTVPFLYAYLRWTEIDLVAVLKRHWLWGVIGGAAVGAFVAIMVVNNEPASPRPEGLELIGSLLWLGVAYGAVDALLLTVLPVSAVWLAFKDAGRSGSWDGKIVAAIVAMAASLVVTTLYHVGYVEFRGSEVTDPLMGNGVISLGYLLTANPITAVIAHIALHIATVLHGIDSAVPLPPHY
jgi:hypothetical protein